MRAGVTGEAVHAAVSTVIKQHGYQMGMPNEDDADAFCGMPHGTGHGIGLDVHEPPLLDRGGPELAFQLLLYPMIDDTHDTPSGHWVRYPKIWNRDLSLKAWAMYLGTDHKGDVSPYAAATRAKDLGGLPPAFISVGTADLFRDENIDYARRLLAAGVPTELSLYAGVPHGGEHMVPELEVSKRMRFDYYDALRRALDHP